MPARARAGGARAGRAAALQCLAAVPVGPAAAPSQERVPVFFQVGEQLRKHRRQGRRPPRLQGRLAGLKEWHRVGHGVGGAVKAQHVELALAKMN